MIGRINAKQNLTGYISDKQTITGLIIGVQPLSGKLNKSIKLSGSLLAKGGLTATLNPYKQTLPENYCLITWNGSYLTVS